MHKKHGRRSHGQRSIFTRMGTLGKRLPTLGTLAVLACSFSLGAPTPAAAATQPGGALLGAFTFDLGLYRIDPTGGTVTQVATVPSGEGTIQDLTADPTSTLLYGSAFACLIPGARGCAESVANVLTIDTSTGASSAAPTPDFLHRVAIDPVDHFLYGLTNRTGVPSAYSSTIVRIDPSTGASSLLATIDGDPQSIALDASGHTLYLDLPNYDSSPYTGQLASVDLITGAVSVRPTVGPALFRLAFDRRTHKLYAMTWDSPSRFVSVNTRTGEITPVGTFQTSVGVPWQMTIDPETHTVFVLQSEFSTNYTAVNRILSLDEHTGAGSLGGPFPGLLNAIVFQDPMPKSQCPSCGA